MGFIPTDSQLIEYCLFKYRGLNTPEVITNINSDYTPIHTTINISKNKISDLKEIALKDSKRGYLARGIEIVTREEFNRIIIKD